MKKPDMVSRIKIDSAEMISDIEKLKASLEGSKIEPDLNDVRPEWNKSINAELDYDDDDEDMGEPMIDTPDGKVHEVIYMKDGQECDEDGNILTAFDEEFYDVDGNEVLL